MSICTQVCREFPSGFNFAFEQSNSCHSEQIILFRLFIKMPYFSVRYWTLSNDLVPNRIHHLLNIRIAYVWALRDHQPVACQSRCEVATAEQLLCTALV